MKRQGPCEELAWVFSLVVNSVGRFKTMPHRTASRVRPRLHRLQGDRATSRDRVDALAVAPTLLDTRLLWSHSQ